MWVSPLSPPPPPLLLLLLLGVLLAGAQKAGGRLSLQLLPPEMVASRGAVCLDGSPAGYYFAPAPPGSRNSTKWVWFLMGGGWCQNETDCSHRASHGVGATSKTKPQCDPHCPVAVKWPQPQWPQPTNAPRCSTMLLMAITMVVMVTVTVGRRRMLVDTKSRVLLCSCVIVLMCPSSSPCSCYV